ncbi:MAG: Uncharacterized protein G01um10147_859 [Microgenomates group bacterium Gr01-1014_7]|nr:MAG: Uncharacterized protein G01um10147_859 [Microgenomates group bacterium Gr01-1014_7]
MNFYFGIFTACCLFFSGFGNIFAPIERALPQPVYQLRKIFTPNILPPKNSYSIVLVGDSMTAALGSGDRIKKYLNENYPKKEFNIKNFSVGSTNILTLPERLQNLTNYNGAINDPVLNTDFDIVIIESFGHNPLSHLSLEEGLKKHHEVLDQAIKQIKDRHPRAVIIFLATIAPHSSRYGEGVVKLNDEQRTVWANERKKYIENHIDYAKKNKIPLINIYEKSGDDYINTTDFIHPSDKGVDFLNREITDYLFTKRIIPL